MMRSGSINLIFGILLSLVLSIRIATAYEVALWWEPSPDSALPGKITSYKLYYSLQAFTNTTTTNQVLIAIPVGLVTNYVISNLTSGTNYYFGVTAVDDQGLESELSNVPSAMLPPEPPPGDSGSTTNKTTGKGKFKTTSATTATAEPSSTPTTTSTSTAPAELPLFGQLPRLSLFSTNAKYGLVVSGTLGATFAIQSSSEVDNLQSWLTLTNLTMSTPAPGANTEPSSSLEKAFVPAIEPWMDQQQSDPNYRFYRIHLPFGYAAVADQVLTQQGFDTRLIAVRLPGIDAYIICYITEETAYLDYNDETFTVALEPSGPTIREIATQVSTTLDQNWSSASEFVVTNGVKQILATVVQTDSPESDPPIGTAQTSAITIDF